MIKTLGPSIFNFAELTNFKKYTHSTLTPITALCSCHMEINVDTVEIANL